ncbi:uncharacterized protein LOC126439219 [Schistocerca serialis cubense]|uniref:uncharacterized protein LOC126439219 n=1 Tax=Schistocerca serialis cubense TaxID=2023355 RepID=UPI00214ED54D|nr:uncharacterized protein LOC126439219 [Schistocerca serialis cubense]
MTVLWAALVGLSWVGAGFLMSSAYDAYLLEPTKFAVDTAYLDWDTVFPAVTICERRNKSRLTEYTKRWQIDLLLETLAYDSPSDLAPSFCRRASCPTDNFSTIVAQIHRPCEELLSRCWWNGEPFACCQHAPPLRTEVGSCFAINSAQTDGNESDRRKLTCNRTTGRGSLKVEVKTEVIMFVHPRDEVPHLTTTMARAVVPARGVRHLHMVRVREARFEPAVGRMGAARRGCRLPGELADWPPALYPVYSRGACVASCRAHRLFQLCNCTPPLTPRLPAYYRVSVLINYAAACEVTVTASQSIKDAGYPLDRYGEPAGDAVCGGVVSPGAEECDLAGLGCLRRSAGQWLRQAPRWAPPGRGLHCDCPLACLDAEVDTVHQRADSIASHTSFYELRLNQLPTERDFRFVANDGLSLVVSIGGAAGLFAGASLLSFVELPYYLCLRTRCCAARHSRPPRPTGRMPFLP